MNWLLIPVAMLFVWHLSLTRSIARLEQALFHHRITIDALMKNAVQQMAEEVGQERFKELTDEAMNLIVDNNPPDIDKLLKDIFKRKGKEDGLGKA